MARVKGGLNAKKRHNRTLKLAKGYSKIQTVQNRKTVCNACSYKCLCRKKTEKETVQTALDRSYQCCSQTERFILQQIHVRLKTG